MTHLTRQLIAVLFVALLAAGWLSVAETTLALQEIPGRPEEQTYFYDEDGMFDEKQTNTLRRDGQLLQSTGIPILVYMREATGEEASPDNAQAFADALRRDWGVASEPGADDGLVMLVSWVPGAPGATTVALSYGAATFDDSGLTPETIQETIDTSVKSLVEQDRPFETLIYLMRETRYAGIYTPPPPEPVTGVAKALHDALRWVAPLLVAGVAISLAVLTRRFWNHRPDPSTIRAAVGSTLGLAVVLWFLSVQAQSRTGIASSLLTIGVLAVAAWVWSRGRFVAHGSRPVRTRQVGSTGRRIRRRALVRETMLRGTETAR